jgi:hypothetical protein
VFLALGALPACSEPCCTIDSFPINLLPLELVGGEAGGASPGAPGGLLALARYPEGNPNGLPSFKMSVDTGASLTFVRRQAERNEGSQMVLRSFDILDAQPPSGRDLVVRGKFRGIEALPLDLDPDPARPEAVPATSSPSSAWTSPMSISPSAASWERSIAPIGYGSSRSLRVSTNSRASTTICGSRSP